MRLFSDCVARRPVAPYDLDLPDFAPDAPTRTIRLSAVVGGAAWVLTARFETLAEADKVACMRGVFAEIAEAGGGTVVVPADTVVPIGEHYADSGEPRGTRAYGVLPPRTAIVGSGPSSVLRLSRAPRGRRAMTGLYLREGPFAFADLGFDMAGASRYAALLFVRESLRGLRMTRCHAFDLTRPDYGTPGELGPDGEPAERNPVDRYFLNVPNSALRMGAPVPPEEAVVEDVWIERCSSRNGMQFVGGYGYSKRNWWLRSNLSDQAEENGFAIVTGSSNVFLERIYLEGNVVRRCRGIGYYLGSDDGREAGFLRDIVLRGNRFEGFERKGSGGSMGIYFRVYDRTVRPAPGVRTGHNRDVLIEDCDLDGGGAPDSTGMRFTGGRVEGGRIENLRIRRTSLRGFGGGGILLGCTGARLEGCTVEGRVFLSEGASGTQVLGGTIRQVAFRTPLAHRAMLGGDASSEAVVIGGVVMRGVRFAGARGSTAAYVVVYASISERGARDVIQYAVEDCVFDGSPAFAILHRHPERFDPSPAIIHARIVGNTLIGIAQEPFRYVERAAGLGAVVVRGNTAG